MRNIETSFMLDKATLFYVWQPVQEASTVSTVSPIMVFMKSEKYVPLYVAMYADTYIVIKLAGWWSKHYTLMSKNSNADL